MIKRLISFLLTLVLLVAIPLSGAYRYNPYTNKLDYYEAAGDVDLGDIGDITLTGLATGNILYYNGTAWVNLAAGANTNVLTLAGGIPSWAAGGAPAAHAPTHLAAGADPVDHDQLLNYLAAQHLTLPNTLVAVLTDHNAAAHVALGFLALPSTIAAVLTDHNLLAHTALGLFDQSSDVDHDLTTNYLAAQHLTLPSTIAAVLTDHNKAAHDALLIDADTVDGEHAAAIVTNARVKAHFPDTIANVLSDHNLAAHTAIGIPNPANVFYISATGGDYTTIQAALTAQNAGGETFLVGPGTYAADTIHFSASDQVVKPLGLPANVIVTQADANIVDVGAWTDCIVEGIEIRLTAPTTAINAIQAGTGTLILIECRGYLATAVALVQADQPSLIGFTGAGTIRIKRGNYQYYHTGNTGGGGIKAAFRANVNLAELHLHKIDVVTITNSGTALATTMYVSSGTAMTEMHNVIDIVVTDPNATLVIGMGYVGGAGAHNLQGNHVDVVATNNTGYGLYHDGTATIRTSFNAIHVSDVAGTSYAFFVGASATLCSHFDDLRSDDGNNVAGTLNQVNSPADGDLVISDELDVFGVSEFNADTNQYEDVFWTWTEAADHASITQTSTAIIEDQALIYIDDDREDGDEFSEATLVIDPAGDYSIWVKKGDAQFDDTVIAANFNTSGSATVGSIIGPAAADLIINRVNNQNITLWSAITSGNPYLYIYGWDAGTTSLKYGRMRIDSGGAFEIDAEETIEMLVATYFEGDTIQYEDLFVTWADALDHAVITQSAVAGTEDQPLIFINDDRTGATANEESEASIRIDADGTYALSLANGGLYLGGTAEFTLGTSINEFSIDGTLGGNSDDAVPTEKAVKTYVDAAAGDVTAGAALTDLAVVRGDGGAKGVKTSTMLISDNGEMTNPSQPCVLAYCTGQNDVTGTTEVYTVIFANEITDQNNDFDGVSTFTAPVDGNYLITCNIMMPALTVGHTSGHLQFITSNRTIIKEYQFFALAGTYNMVNSIVTDFDAADTLTVTIQVGNDTKTVDIWGSVNLHSFLSVTLLN